MTKKIKDLLKDLDPKELEQLKKRLRRQDAAKRKGKVVNINGSKGNG